MNMAAAADQPDDVMAHALAYALAGWRVVPIGPGIKHPRLPEWQKAATTDPAMVTMWWTGMYRGHGVGIVTGSESRIWVLDVDVSDGKNGDETLADLEAAHGNLPETVEVQTGSGGRHLYFRWPAGRSVRNDASKRLGSGLDVRGEGGQVLAPPTIHPNGMPYVWVIGQAWDEHNVANAPAWLLDLVCEVPAPAPERTLTLPSTELVLTRTDRPGDKWADTITWKQLLEADGWTFHHADTSGEEFWTRPGKERRDGASATLYFKGADVLKVFSSSIPELAPEATYSKFHYLATTRFKGDHRAASQWCAEQLEPRPIVAAPAAPVAPLEPSQFEAVAMRGGDALASVEDAPPARWGDDDYVLWASGESLLITGRTGTGKTTLAIGILSGLVGIDDMCLGLTIRAAHRVLYLGMDRPRQILRAMQRRFGPETFKILNDKLVFRKGPLPKDLAKEPSLLLTLAQQYDCDVVVVDSLKDAAVKVTDDEVGGQINRAVQMCNAHDVDVLVLHHQRKGNVADRKNEDDVPTVEDVYGSSWITAGAGSVIILQGQPGDNLVRLHHVKQPADPVGPWMLEHDHHAGRTTRQEGGFDLLVYLKSRGQLGTSAIEAARVEAGNEKLKADGNEAARIKRRLDGLVKTGHAKKIGGGGHDDKGRKVAARWYVDMVNLVTPDARKSPDAVPDGWSSKETLTQALTSPDVSTNPQVTPLTRSLTFPDQPPALTVGGGIYSPQRQGGDVPEVF